MVGRLSQELESEEKELMEVKAAFVELSRKYTEGEELTKLKDNVDQMKAETRSLTSRVMTSKRHVSFRTAILPAKVCKGS